jgi:zona occludens toxin
MIELNTGVPGSGKTLSMVQRLSKLQSQWISKPELGRPVFVLGIPDLILPHSPVPLLSVQIAKAGSPSLVPDWDLMPDGSLVIIDEAQGCFPPRSSASTPPAHVSWLNVHRHRGFDIWLTTQHPKLIDASVRALVGKHQHYRRLFGGSRAVCYEWDACSDSLSGTKTAIKSFFPYPKNIFKFYKSAEIHTKQNFKLPLWAFIPVIGLVMGIIFFPKAYGVLHSGMTGQGLSTSSPVKTLSIAPPPAAGALAPVSRQVQASVVDLPPTLVSALDTSKVLISGCIASASKCQCYSDRGIKLHISEEECRLSVDAPTTRFKLNDEITPPAVSPPPSQASSV